MFDLESAINVWRERLAAGGVTSCEVLDELESHLRDELTLRSGLETQQAFETAVEHVGHADLLKTEFAKIGGIREMPGKVKRAFFTFAGVPGHHLTTPMNTSYSNIEPRWATYVKASAFLAPAIFLWMTTAVFILPKLNQVYYDAHIEAPGVFQRLIPFNSAILSVVKDHSLYIFAATLVTLILLEWRSSKWPKFRRATIGAGVFVLNAAALFSIFIIILAAVFTAASLFDHAK